jgi:hypothetical protein
MTDKIKSAREDVEHVSIMWRSTKYKCVLKPETIQTILKALSAYEKLQGVDLEKLNAAFEIENESNPAYMMQLIKEYKQIYKEMPTIVFKQAAQLVADIGKDG